MPLRAPTVRYAENQQHQARTRPQMGCLASRYTPGTGSLRGQAGAPVNANDVLRPQIAEALDLVGQNVCIKGGQCHCVGACDCSVRSLVRAA